jgi:hypothetical protein
VRYIAQPGTKLLDQARLTKAWFADNHYQLPVALPRALPAPHQHAEFFFAAYEQRQMALSDAASAATRPDDPEQRHRLGHAFEFMSAAFLGDEQPSDLALHPRCQYHGIGLG